MATHRKIDQFALAEQSAIISWAAGLSDERLVVVQAQLATALNCEPDHTDNLEGHIRICFEARQEVIVDEMSRRTDLPQLQILCHPYDKDADAFRTWRLTDFTCPPRLSHSTEERPVSLLGQSLDTSTILEAQQAGIPAGMSTSAVLQSARLKPSTPLESAIREIKAQKIAENDRSSLATITCAVDYGRGRECRESIQQMRQLQTAPVQTSTLDRQVQTQTSNLVTKPVLDVNPPVSVTDNSSQTTQLEARIVDECRGRYFIEYQANTAAGQTLTTRWVAAQDTPQSLRDGWAEELAQIDYGKLLEED